MTQLAALQITTATTAAVTSPVSGLGKPQAASITARLAYVASAATSITARVQTSIDGGATWWDVAAFQFTTASASSYVNISGLKEANVPVALSDGTLAANSSLNGLLGDRYRLKYDSVGTYGAGTTLIVDIETR
jgi:hypothetical protein